MKDTIRKTYEQPPPTLENELVFEKISAPYYYLC